MINKELIVELVERKHSNNNELGFEEIIDIIKEFNPLEKKTVLTEEEAKWLEKLKAYAKKNPSYGKYDSLYFITRIDSPTDFYFYDEYNECEVRLCRYKPAWENAKDRLIQAYLYGYEVEITYLYKLY